MKIAIVHSFYRSGPSGENIAVQMQANALAEAGHEVRVISRSTDDFINQPGYSLASGITAATGVGPSPLKRINEFDPDIVHVHNLFPNWGDRWLAKLTYPLVATIHNFRPLCAAGTLSLNGSPCELCPKKGSHHAVKNKCYHDSKLRTIPLAVATRRPESSRLLMQAHKLIFLHQTTRATFENHIPDLDLEGSEVIPNFVEDLAIKNLGEVAEKKRDKPWVFVGRLSVEKGILPLVQSWPLDEKLTVVGTGPQAQEIRSALNGKQIEMAGYLNPETIPQLLRGAKGLVMPSVVREQSPLSFIEALRAAIPVVAKAGSVVSELVGLYDCGSVFNSFPEVGTAINQTPRALENKGRNARMLFESLFTKEIWLQSMIRSYEDLRNRVVE